VCLLGKPGLLIVLLAMFRHVGSKVKAHEDSVWCLGWAGPTNRLVTGSVDESVKVWNPDDMGAPLHTFDSNELAVVGLALDGAGERAVSSSMDGFLRVYNIMEGKKEHQIDSGSNGCWAVAYHPSAAMFASGTKTGTVVLYNADTGEPAEEMDSKAGTYCMSAAFSPDGKHLAAGDSSGLIQIFDANSGKCVHKIDTHVQSVRALTFSPDSRTLLAGSNDRYISVYDVAGGQAVNSFSAHTSWVLSLSHSPATAGQFASAGADKKVKLWDLRQRECLHAFESHKEQVWGVAFNQDGTKLASVGDDANINLYDIKDK
jgi:WD repeat-containing protein 61